MENKIKQILIEKGITQKELASMIGMTEVGVSKAVNGSTSQATLNKIAEVLSVDVSELIQEPELYAKYASGDTPLELGDILLDCYVLNNGMRVFSGRGMQKALGNKSKSGQWMKSFVNTPSLKEYFYAGDNSVADRLNSPVKFRRRDAGGSQLDTYGFEATLLIDICSAILDANRAGIFNDGQIVFNSDCIIRAVAKVGIIALVDEATGYNKEKTRAKDELQKFLNGFLREEASKWVKVFDDTFFEDLYKMHNWSWAQTSKRPGVVGTWINDIVYQRIGPMILAELQERNPSENGRRKIKHHQLLTEEIGIPKLKEHLHSLHALALVSNFKWDVFMHYVDKAFPKQYQQLELFEELYME